MRSSASSQPPTPPSSSARRGGGKLHHPDKSEGTPSASPARSARTRCCATRRRGAATTPPSSNCVVGGCTSRRAATSCCRALAATPVPVACVATVGRRALVGLPEGPAAPTGRAAKLAAAWLAELAEAALPVGAADGAFAFFTLSGDAPLHGVAVVRDAVAVRAEPAAVALAAPRAPRRQRGGALPVVDRCRVWRRRSAGAAAGVARGGGRARRGYPRGGRGLRRAAAPRRGGRDLLRTLKLLALETRLLVARAPHPRADAARRRRERRAAAAARVGGAARARVARPARPVPPAAAGAADEDDAAAKLPQPPSDAWRPLEAVAVLPGVGVWHTSELRRATAPAGAPRRRTARRARSWRRSRTPRSRSSRMAVAVRRSARPRCSIRRWRRRRRRHPQKRASLATGMAARGARRRRRVGRRG